MIRIIRENLKIFYILSFIAIFTVPKGSALFFDGLPWSSREEIILFVVFFPFLFFLKSDQLKTKLLIYTILLLNILSFLLFFSSKIGISHKQFFDIENVNKNNLIRTYESIWFSEFSAIQKKNWKNKSNFPLDWSARHPLNFNKKTNLNYFNNYDEFTDLKLFYKSNFFLVVNQKNNVQININGMNQFKSTIKYENISNNSKSIIVNTNEKFILDDGIYKFEIDAALESKNWSYEILFVKNDIFIDAIKDKKVFYELDSKNVNLILFYNLTGSVFDYLIVLLSLILLFSTIRKYKLLNTTIILSIIFITSNLIFLKINSLIQFDGTGIFGLVLFLIILLIIYLFKDFTHQNYNQKIDINNLFFVITFFIIIFFSWINYEGIENIAWFSKGDDWEIFQVLGRLIAVDNIWAYQNELETIRRYGIRILVAFLHVIFGKSFFPQQILEIWAIALSAYLFTKILLLSKIKDNLAIFFGFLLLIIYFGENFRWLIGRGLIEYFSLFLIMLTAYLFSKNYDPKKTSFSKIILPCFLGFLIVIFREDQIIFACGLVFFGIFNNLKSNSITFFLKTIKEEFKLISFYYFFLILGLVFILSKNFISFDTLGIGQDALYFKIELLKNMIFDNYEIKQNPLIGDNDINNLYASIDGRHYFDSIYRFFTASDPYNMPRPTSVILICGFLFSIYFLFCFKVHKDLNVGIVILPILCFISPLIILNETYNPRYTICYLPFALMSVCTLTNIFINKFDLYNRSN